jgi:hypothetical protein
LKSTWRMWIIWKTWRWDVNQRQEPPKKWHTRANEPASVVDLLCTSTGPCLRVKLCSTDVSDELGITGEKDTFYMPWESRTVTFTSYQMTPLTTKVHLSTLMRQFQIWNANNALKAHIEKAYCNVIVSSCLLQCMFIYSQVSVIIRWAESNIKYVRSGVLLQIAHWLLARDGN